MRRARTRYFTVNKYIFQKLFQPIVYSALLQKHDRRHRYPHQKFWAHLSYNNKIPDKIPPGFFDNYWRTSYYVRVKVAKYRKIFSMFLPHQSYLDLEERNNRISGPTQQLLYSKSHDFRGIFALAHSKIDHKAWKVTQLTGGILARISLKKCIIKYVKN